MSISLIKDIAKPILAGFGITARRLGHPKVTIMYPEVRREQYPRTRWLHALKRYDSGLEKCIGCPPVRLGASVIWLLRIVALIAR